MSYLKLLFSTVLAGFAISWYYSSRPPPSAHYIKLYKAAIANGITKEEIEEATGRDEPNLN